MLSIIQVSTIVTWKELLIEGVYEFFDRLSYLKSKYQIVLKNVSYKIDTPLSKNVELYPSSAPDNSITYDTYSAVTVGNQPFPVESTAAQ